MILSAEPLEARHASQRAGRTQASKRATERCRAGSQPSRPPSARRRRRDREGLQGRRRDRGRSRRDDLALADDDAELERPVRPSRCRLNDARSPHDRMDVPRWNRRDREGCLPELLQVDKDLALAASQAAIGPLSPPWKQCRQSILRRQVGANDPPQFEHSRLGRRGSRRSMFPAAGSRASARSWRGIKPAGTTKGDGGSERGGGRGGNISGTCLSFRSAYHRRSRDRQCAQSRTVRLTSGIPHRTHSPSSMRRCAMAVADLHFRSKQARQICRAGARPETRLRAGVPSIWVPHKIQAPMDSRRCSNRRAGWSTSRQIMFAAGQRRCRCRQPGPAGRCRL